MDWMMIHTHHKILNITKNNYDIIVSLILIAAMASLCVYPFLYYRKLLVSHDITFHLFQSVQFYKSIMSGTLIPRWAMDTNNGYGSANFIFYSPISYYVICFYKLFMSSIILSMISAIWTSYFLSGISMFYVIRGYVNTQIALLCALLYQIFPFHMIDLYLRGAVAELFAFVWFPIIFKYLNEMFVPGRARVAGIWLSLSYAGLVMTHLVSAFIFMILILLYCVIQLLVNMKKESVVYVILWILLSMGIVSCQIIPTLFEQKYVHIDYILKYTFGDYSKNFLLDICNLSANRITAYSNHFIGVIDVVIFVDIVLFLVLSYFIVKETKYIINNGLVFISIFFISMAIFMSTPLSKWLWSVMKPLKTIQFPWRWMAYLELGLIFLLATYLKDAKSFKDLIFIKKYRLAVYTFSALLVISILCILFPNHHLPDNVINKILYPESFGYDVGQPREYTPVWAVDLEKILTLPPPERISVISGKANARAVYWEPEKRVIEVQAESPAVLRVATFYYPGWVAESNGRRKTVSIEKKSGAMLVALEPGDRIITLSFVDTAVRRIAKFISLVSMVIFFLFWYKIRSCEAFCFFGRSYRDC